MTTVFFLFLVHLALGIMAIATHPRFVLVAMAYAYLASAFVGLAVSRLRHRGQTRAAGPSTGGVTAAGPGNQ